MKIVIIQVRGFLNGSGGTEKIGCYLANNLAKNNFEVEIATNEHTSGNPFFPLDEMVQITNIFDKQHIQKHLLDLHNYKGKNPFSWMCHKVVKKYTKLRNKILLKKMGGIDGLNTFNLSHRSQAWNKYIIAAKPDLIITMNIGSLLEITYENNYEIPIINSVNGRPDYDYSDLLWYRSENEMRLIKESYKNLAAIQVLFDSYNNYLPDTFTGQAVTISNPVLQVNDSEIIDHCKEKERFKIINVASLVISCKQQDIAISVFSGVANKYLNWDLHFWGIGNDLEKLQNQVKVLGIEDRVFFNGFTSDPLEKMRESDLFIFPSKYEGFPLALVEAMSVGLPSVGFETCSGVNELIEHTANGFLAKDENAMRESLEVLMTNKNLRQQMGIIAHEMVKKYNEKDIMNKWLDLITQFRKN
ncbi:glycosyltransferase [Flavobacterium aquicola]|uniref:Glycosyltransferase involved in cell wall biosynthesis n=1 Tax=Flavobacterium aquicola TaxID=1682742 RepID=A0A3E0ESJ8_9FLAO|nr:glycosyltransferase [Flavobacterium aquicola]REH01116.1 glycosyltransferase involved in cell wall biosynthesis [Flavobacterium aquicola]